MLKLGEKIISDIYLGDKKIAKVFWGDKLVYQAGKPIFLDYITFDGASYIDTGIVPNDKTGSYIHLCSSSRDDAIVLGCRESRSTDSRCYLCATVRGEVNFGRDVYYYIQADGRIGNSSGLALPYDTFYEQYTNYLNSRNIRVIEKSSNVDITTGAIKVLTSTQTQSMFLGGAQVEGTASFYFKGSIKQCVITEENQIVQDLRPCIDPKGIVCMYDLVTKKYFYNQGTGTLTAGNKINFVDYIQFDGESWIDVDYIPSSNTRVVGKVSFTQWHPNAGANYVFGVYGNNANFGLNVGSNRTILNVPWGNSSAIPFSNDNTFGQVYSFDISKNGAYLDGILKIATSQLSEEFTATKSFYVGWANGTGTNQLVGNIYPMQIYENDVLVKDLRPCVVAGVAGFYDMVTGKVFTNAGTGTLKASGRFVESIVFDGASWIDTGIILSSNHKVSVKAMVTVDKLATSMQLFGNISVSTKGFSCNVGKNDGAISRFDGVYYTGNLYQDDGNVHTFTVDKNGITIDSVVKNWNGTPADFQQDESFYLGTARGSSYAIPKGTQIYTEKVWENDVLIQDLRPYVDENGTACFKDVVTGNLFYNQGTGKLEYTE
jgi:hypothetical protein